MARLSPAAISIVSSDITIDAEALAPELGLSVETLKKNMAKHLVTSVAETGIGTDAGRTRLTSHYRARVWRVVVEAEGTVVERIAGVAKVPLAKADQPSLLDIVGPAS